MKKRRIVSTLIFICALFALTIFARQPLFADVKFGEGDCVHLGAFAHWTAANGPYETAPTPVTWQVRSADAGSMLLLSHYLVDYRVWNPDNTGLTAPLQNDAWKDKSALRVFINNTGAGGFLEHFNASELALMSTAFASADADTYVPGDKATIPSASEMSDGGLMGFQDDAARKADFKTPTVPTNSSRYWLRTSSRLNDRNPAAAIALDSGALNDFGHIVINKLGIRPVTQISLNPVIFKSKYSDVIDPSPFTLFLSGEKKTGYPEFAPDGIEIDKAETDGYTLTLTFAKEISPAVREWPHPDDFTLRHSGGDQMHPESVEGDDSDAKKLVLTFAIPVTKDETVTLDYNLNHDAAAFDVTASTAKVMASFSDIAVINSSTLSETVVPGEIVVDDETLCWVIVTYNLDGTVLVEIRLPLIEGFDAAKLEALAAAFVSPFTLSNVSYHYVDADGKKTPIPARGTNEPYILITGTAKSIEALKAAELSHVSYWFTGGDREYRQRFGTPLAISDMMFIYVNDRPGGGGGSSGCDAGFGIAALITLAGLALRRKR